MPSSWQEREKRPWARRFRWQDDYGITWGEFFEHYRRMVNMGPLPSVRSESPVARALRRPIRAIDRLLGPGPRMPEYESAPILVRGARSELMRLRARLTRHAPLAIGIWTYTASRGS